MTEAEYTAAVAEITKLETEKAETHQAVLQSIAAARKQNETTKALQAKLAAIDEAMKPITQAAEAYVAAVNAERKRIANEKAQAEAAARAKAEAEAAAAKAAEQSELAKASAEIERLKAELAAKG